MRLLPRRCLVAVAMARHGMRHAVAADGCLSPKAVEGVCSSILRARMARAPDGWW